MFSSKHQADCFTAILGSLKLKRLAEYIGKLPHKMKNSGRGGRKGEKETSEAAAQEHRATLTATVLTTSQKVFTLFVKQKSPTLIY